MSGSYDPTIEDGDDTIKILITTDNHVGYKENDAIRGEDSSITFEEIASIAEARDVDMIVHSGDLFHINKPSKKSIYNTMKSLRQHCMGDRPCELEYLSDPTIVNRYGTINYEDPNLNISIPVFAISGNHDDATGSQLLSPLDVLSVSGLVNHFGKVFDNNKFQIKPLLLRKGSTYLALYGMQSIKDDRLYRLLTSQELKFLKPSLKEDSWFNLMCVHQNHVGHSKTSYLPEEMLPGFLDFVIWGHEHESKPEAEYNEVRDFHVLQPGSSIATSLADGEVPQKHVFILRINNKKFDLEPIPLKTVRPFYMDSVVLEHDYNPKSTGPEELKEFLVGKVEGLLNQAHDNYARKNNDDLVENDTRNLPLLRLKVDYTEDYDFETPQRLSKSFIGKVANIDDIFLFNKIKPLKQPSMFENTKFKDFEVRGSGITIDYLISQFVEQSKLNILSEKGINEAVKNSIDKEDKHILNDYIKKEIKFHKDNLLKVDLDSDEEDSSKKGFKSMLASLRKADEEHTNKKSEVFVNDMSDTEEGINSKSKSRKPAPPRKSTTRKPPQRKAKVNDVVTVDSDEDFEIPGSEDDQDYSNVVNNVNEQDQEIIESDDEPPPLSSRGSRKGKRAVRGKTRGSSRGGRGSKGGRGKSSTSSGATNGDLFSMLQGMH